MTSVGGNVESKNINLNFGTSGTFVDCEFINGRMQLKQISVDSDGTSIYASQGTWTSATINIGDNFKEYGKIIASEIKQGNSSIKLETRTSLDGVTFGEWQDVLIDGTVVSTKYIYIQVRLTFYADFGNVNFYLSKGNNTNDAVTVFNNNFINTSNGIELKRDYNLTMDRDASWSDTGYLHKELINRNDWYKIDKLNVLPANANNKSLILNGGAYKKWNVTNGWSNVSTTLPNSSVFNSNGMNSLTTLLDRRVTTLNLANMTRIKTDVVSTTMSVKVFSKTMNLDKYLDIRSLTVSTIN